MDATNLEIISQQFIETQLDTELNYQNFCQVRSGERVPYISTQHVARQGQQNTYSENTEFTTFNTKINNFLDSNAEDDIYTEVEVLDMSEMKLLPSTATVASQTEPSNHSDSINKGQFEYLVQCIENIQKGQKSLMKEFIHLRDNRLNVRYLVDCDNYKFTLPFADIDLFVKFDTSLIENQESKKQLISIFMKESNHDLKKFIRTNFKNTFTEELFVASHIMDGKAI